MTSAIVESIDTSNAMEHPAGSLVPEEPGLDESDSDESGSEASGPGPIGSVVDVGEDVDVDDAVDEADDDDDEAVADDLDGSALAANPIVC